METIMIVLLHGGRQHEPSNKILEYIEQKNIEGITPICIVDEQMKRIIENHKNIKITEIPSLIIYRDKNVSEVYPGTKENVRYILKQLKSA